MIRAARSRHRAMVLTLALVVPLLFVAGLRLRQSIPVTDTVSPSGSSGSGEMFEALGEQKVGEALPIRVSWLLATSPPARHAVALTLEAPPESPDLLVYWDDDPGDASVPSEAARLLGRVGRQPEEWWEVPDPSHGGRLVFYSTARKQVAASMSPPEGWADTP